MILCVSIQSCYYIYEDGNSNGVLQVSDTNAELVKLGNQVALLEEEKGNLQLSLVDFDELKGRNQGKRFIAGVSVVLVMLLNFQCEFCVDIFTGIACFPQLRFLHYKRKAFVLVIVYTYGIAIK